MNAPRLQRHHRDPHPAGSSTPDAISPPGKSCEPNRSRSAPEAPPPDRSHRGRAPEHFRRADQSHRPKRFIALRQCSIAWSITSCTDASLVARCGRAVEGFKSRCRASAADLGAVTGDDHASSMLADLGMIKRIRNHRPAEQRQQMFVLQPELPPRRRMIPRVRIRPLTVHGRCHSLHPAHIARSHHRPFACSDRNSPNRFRQTSDNGIGTDIPQRMLAEHILLA